MGKITNQELDPLLSASIENLQSTKVIKSNKDSEGLFTTVEYRRIADNTLAVKSVLSGGATPKYTTRTVTYYALDGITVVNSYVFALSYDADGVLISEV